MALLFYFIEKQRIAEIEYLEKELNQRDKGIERNASFAKKIGEGDFDTQFLVEDDDDLLGNSLLLMRDNLKENNKKNLNRIGFPKEKILFLLFFECIITLKSYLMRLLFK